MLTALHAMWYTSSSTAREGWAGTGFVLSRSRRQAETVQKSLSVKTEAVKSHDFATVEFY